MDAETDYHLNGISLFRIVNALALAAEWRGLVERSTLGGGGRGYAHYWAGPFDLQYYGNEWDDITRLAFQ